MIQNSHSRRSLRKHSGWMCHALLCLCALASVPACRPSAPPVGAGSPADLLERLRQVHREHRYAELEEVVDPPRLTTLVRTLMAVDRLLAISQQLKESAEQHVGPTAAEACNLSVLADYLGPFSRNVRIVSTYIDADTAWIAYQVGERVPIERAQLRLAGGRWLYVPDGADEKLPDLLRQLTDELVALKAEADHGRHGERAFMEEYDRRVREPLAAHLAQDEQARKTKRKSND